MKFASPKTVVSVLGLLLHGGLAAAATKPPGPEQVGLPAVPQQCCGGNSGNPGPNTSIQLGPLTGKPGELAQLTFKAVSKPLPASPRTQRATTQFCVLPAITVTGPNAWSTSFEVLLLDKAAKTGFKPILVTTPIPAGSTRELLAAPPWCANGAANAPPTGWVVQTPFGSRAVVFEANPTASPR